MVAAVTDFHIGHTTSTLAVSIKMLDLGNYTQLLHCFFSIFNVGLNQILVLVYNIYGING